MSKKNKRQSRNTPSMSPRVSDAAATSSSGNGGSKAMFSREFNPDYSMTVKDLRRIGMLAGSFFVVLVVLTFILR